MSKHLILVGYTRQAPTSLAQVVEAEYSGGGTGKNLSEGVYTLKDKVGVCDSSGSGTNPEWSDSLSVKNNTGRLEDGTRRAPFRGHSGGVLQADAAAAEGKPRRRNPSESRQRILEAGMKHFARAGLGGARVVDIIKDANLSHRMLYHYFESKELLYLATLEFAYQRIREAERKLRLESLDPSSGIRRLVEFTFDYYVNHPEFMALLNQENLNGGEFITKSDALRIMQRPLIEAIDRLLDEGVATSVFAVRPDSVQFYIDVAGLCYFGITNRHTLSAIFSPRVSQSRYLARRRAHVVEFVLNSLLKR